MTVFALGDSAVVITLADTVDEAMAARVRTAAAAIARQPPAGVTDIVPAFASIALFFDPERAPAFEALRAEVTELVARSDDTAALGATRTVELAVSYGGDFGPDLDTVAQHTGLSAEQVIARHADREYLVHAIGFAPGFPYLGGLAPELATPRRPTPRPRVPAGAVGIGGVQTGVYSLETPGGWNLIGRTPRRLFDAAREEASLLRAGDRVKFRPISAEQFQAMQEALTPTPRRLASAATLPGIEVIRAGMLTSVQDLGRKGHRAAGVPLGGATDSFALRLVNALVGNSESAAVLEFTLIGPELKFLHDAVVAVGGADYEGIARWQPFKVTAGSTLKLGAARAGCRGYLAVAGGIDVPAVLGSRSTYARAVFGGFEGRALRDGDVLPVPAVHREVRRHWHIDERILPPYSAEPEVRVIAGAHAAAFDERWTERRYRISPQSDRMGARLSGDPLLRQGSGDLISSPVAPGTIQVPPDGQPIVLLADAQTIGGYPRLAHVISVDLPLVAQLRPGDGVRFRVVSLDEARALHAAREQAFAFLREGLAQKLA